MTDFVIRHRELDNWLAGAATMVNRRLEPKGLDIASLPLSVEALSQPQDLKVITSILGENQYAMMAVEDATRVVRRTNPGSELELRVVYGEATAPKLQLVAWLTGDSFEYEADRDELISWWRTRPAVARKVVLLLPRHAEAKHVQSA